MDNAHLNGLVELINKEIDNTNFGEHPVELYEPIRYILALGGKRMRPLLTLLGCQLWQEDVTPALKPAIAVEVFHNFTLMHDDIMDNAPLRRGEATVHEKWNSNIAILSGDVMMVKAYDLMLHVPDYQFKQVVTKFNKCAAEVCEGQQLDMNFESLSKVSEAEYLHMIQLKTAVLLGFSLELGAILANADAVAQQQIYEFGMNIGVGFQLKDDLLDVYADKDKFGKQVGGDIISNKKTFLLIKALERAEGAQELELNQWLTLPSFDPQKKVEAVTAIYDSLKIKELTEQKMNEYFEKGFSSLERLEAPTEKKLLLKNFAEYLINREK